MRRPHVYERSAPRNSRTAYREPSDTAATGRTIAAQITPMIDKAEAAGLRSLADLLELARVEAEKDAKGER